MAADIYPPMNLAPEAMKWGRDMQRRVQQLEADAARRAQSDLNTNKQQSATIQSLQEATGHLNSLTLTSVNGADLNTQGTPGDQTFRWFSSSPALTLKTTAATGNLLVTVGSGQCTLNPGNLSAIAALSFSMSAPSGWSYGLDWVDARLYSVNGLQIGVPLIVSRSIAVPSTEQVTINVQYGIWSSSQTTAASANFQSNYAMAQVIN